MRDVYKVSIGIYEVKRNIGLILKFILKYQGESGWSGLSGSWWNTEMGVPSTY